MDFLTLFASLRCTQSCAHCIYGCSPRSGEHMPMDVFKRTLEIASEHRIPTLNFFGGEPLLNPEILSMIGATLEAGLSLILATNSRPLAKEKFLDEFLEQTKLYRDRIVLFIARDRFHLEFFDPSPVIERLRAENYQVQISDYSDYTVALSEHNAWNQELQKMNTEFSCCAAKWTDFLGVLPDGGWTICPPSLEAFGNIFTNSLDEIIEFKRELPMRYELGCTTCLKDFKTFRSQFDAIARKKTNYQFRQPG